MIKYSKGWKSPAKNKNWIYIIILMLAFLWSCFAPHGDIIAETRVADSNDYVVAPAPTDLVQSATSAEDIIRQVAIRENFNPNLLVKLAQCESSLRPNVLGDGGKSRGLFQIHSGYHPEVSDEVAFDPTLSAEWTIWHIKSGYASEWACWNIIN